MCPKTLKSTPKSSDFTMTLTCDIEVRPTYQIKINTLRLLLLQDDYADYVNMY